MARYYLRLSERQAELAAGLTNLHWPIPPHKKAVRQFPNNRNALRSYDVTLHHCQSKAGIRPATWYWASSNLPEPLLEFASKLLDATMPRDPGEMKQVVTRAEYAVATSTRDDFRKERDEIAAHYDRLQTHLDTVVPGLLPKTKIRQVTSTKGVDCQFERAMKVMDPVLLNRLLDALGVPGVLHFKPEKAIKSRLIELLASKDRLALESELVTLREKLARRTRRTKKK